jgi:hypothetical protein
MILLGFCRDCKRLFNKPKELEDKDICPVCGSENWRYTLQRECDLHNPTGGSKEIFIEGFEKAQEITRPA